jgi:thiol-disulfide isomerase/thioredoxin
MRRILALFGVLIASCGTAPLVVHDLDGRAFEPLDPRGAAHVLVFVTTDCPIANSYAPEIEAIAREHAADPLRFFLVHVDPDVDADAARTHARDYGYASLPILLDPEHRLVGRLGITVTPEAAVVLPGGELAYRGRIDNVWGDFGSRRREPSRRDLRLAIGAVLAGHPVEPARTEAIGCFVPEPLARR